MTEAPVEVQVTKGGKCGHIIEDEEQRKARLLKEKSEEIRLRGRMHINDQKETKSLKRQDLRGFMVQINKYNTSIQHIKKSVSYNIKKRKGPKKENEETVIMAENASKRKLAHND